jgi:hypothetical protein
MLMRGKELVDAYNTGSAANSAPAAAIGEALQEAGGIVRPPGLVAGEGGAPESSEAKRLRLAEKEFAKGNLGRKGQLRRPKLTK